MLEMNEIKQIEKWTNKKLGEIIFDSNIHSWKRNTSILDSKIIGKSKLLFLIEDERNNLFGYYFDSLIENKYHTKIPTNKNSFIFSLRSNGRINGMMKFEIKKTECGLWIHKKDDNLLLSLGYCDIYLYKDNEKFSSYCKQDNNDFNYNGYLNVLTGSYNFVPKRFFIIQMN